MATETTVDVRGLSKQYRVHQRPPGVAAALKSVFRRTYKTVHAVQDLSFSVAAGERVGFLGPNGAGKTTTLKVLAGLLHPTSGEVRVLGHLPQRRDPDFLKRITLVMGQKQQLLWDLPPVETFALNRAIYEVGDAEFQRTMRELEELLGIADIAQKPTRQLSLGERMKCELAAALLHRPGVLFLDEPTIGLDVSMQLAVREFIERYNERSGATVLLTSHDMDDVAALCSRVVVIDKGTLRYDGSLTELARSVRPEKRVVLRLGAPATGRVELPLDLGAGAPATESPSSASTRSRLEQVGEVVRLEGRLAVLQVPKAKLREVVSHLLGWPDVEDLTIEDPPLEEVMRELFAGGSP